MAAVTIAEFLASVGFKADEGSLKSALAKVAGFGAANPLNNITVCATSLHGYIRGMGGFMADKDTGVIVAPEDVVNDILPFCAQGVEGRDMLSQAAYTADLQRGIGHQPGIARQELANKQARQTSHIAAGLAQFLARRYAPGVKDDGDLDRVESALVSVILDLLAPRLPGLATLLQPGLVMPDGSTIVVDAEGRLSSLGATPWRDAVDYTSPILVIGLDGKVYRRLSASGPNVDGVGAKIPGFVGSDTYWDLVQKDNLKSDLNLYVATTGSDSNDGLSVSQPCRSINKAVSVVCNNYDLKVYNAIINIADGTYDEYVVLQTNRNNA